MTEPKLLTEHELLGLLEWNTPEQILAELRERSLIADGPVDPSLVEAAERLNSVLADVPLTGNISDPTARLIEARMAALDDALARAKASEVQL